MACIAALAFGVVQFARDNAALRERIVWLEIANDRQDRWIKGALQQVEDVREGEQKLETQLGLIGLASRVGWQNAEQVLQNLRELQQEALTEKGREVEE